MIDVEPIVFDKVYEAIKSAVPLSDISSTYVDVPAAFPHISIVEMDNAVFKQSADLDSRENHAKLMYQVDIYSNKQALAKSECKKIGKIVDEKLLSLGFTRISSTPTPNVERGIYRITARYEAVVGKGIADASGNTTYPIYFS